MITAIGALILPICLFSMGNPVRLLSLVFICSAFVAAAVIVIGGYGISPGLVPTALFVAFFILKTIFGTRYPAERLALQVLLPFIIVIIWALASSILMPRIFEEAIFVWPQKGDVFATLAPLEPSSGNITQDLYLTAAAILTVCAACFLTAAGLPLGRLFNAYLIAGLLVCAIAVWQLVSNFTGLFFPTTFFLSNPGWALLSNESIGGFVRLTGPCSEPSGLAGYLCGIAGASGWIVLNGHRGRLPLAAFIASLLIVLVTTSATGYATLAIMAGLVANYAILFGNPTLRRRVLFGVAGLGALAATASVTVPVVAPGIAHSASIVLTATLNKNQSSSYNARTQSDRDSVRAMEQSYGLGVGWGSDRSSSLIPGLLAGVGAIGMAGLAWFTFRVFRHLRAAHRLNPPADLQMVLRGCTGGITGTLIALALAGPTITSPDFYLLLALLIATAARIRHSATVMASQTVFPASYVRTAVQDITTRPHKTKTFQAWRV